jgi:hypothetical protein
MVPGNRMLRALGIFGLGGAFLLISPSLRGSVMGLIEATSNYLTANSPLSYVCLGVVGLVVAMIWVYKAAQPRC